MTFRKIYSFKNHLEAWLITLSLSSSASSQVQLRILNTWTVALGVGKVDLMLRLWVPEDKFRKYCVRGSFAITLKKRIMTLGEHDDQTTIWKHSPYYLQLLQATNQGRIPTSHPAFPGSTVTRIMWSLKVNQLNSNVDKNWKHPGLEVLYRSSLCLPAVWWIIFHPGCISISWEASAPE